MATANTTSWEEYVSDIYFTVGITRIRDTNGTFVTASNVASSTKNISYAMILFSPYNSVYLGAAETRKVMVHEIGHALCLGHVTSSVASIMKQGYNGYEIVQNYDYLILEYKYS